MTDVLEQSPPLTQLSEEEQLLRANVRAFAQAEIAPLVREMDEAAAIPRALIDQLFELGVMAIEIPETFGGAGAHFFLSVIAVEELSRVDPSVAVLVDVQNTLVINALLKWGLQRHQAAVPPEAGQRHGRSLRLVGGGCGQRCLRARDPRPWKTATTTC